MIATLRARARCPGRPGVEPAGKGADSCADQRARVGGTSGQGSVVTVGDRRADALLDSHPCRRPPERGGRPSGVRWVTSTAAAAPTRAMIALILLGRPHGCGAPTSPGLIVVAALPGLLLYAGGSARMSGARVPWVVAPFTAANARLGASRLSDVRVPPGASPTTLTAPYLAVLRLAGGRPAGWGLTRRSAARTCRLSLGAPEDGTSSIPGLQRWAGQREWPRHLRCGRPELRRLAKSVDEQGRTVQERGDSVARAFGVVARTARGAEAGSPLIICPRWLGRRSTEVV